MANKTGDFDVLKLTNAGRDMLTQGRAGHIITFTKVVIGDGTATGSAIDSLTAIKSPKLTLPIAKSENVHAGQMRLQFRVSNSLVNTSFYFREIGLMAKVDNGPETLYAYTTCGDKAKLVYDKTYPIQEKIINIDTVTDNAVNVKVILDLSIMYATRKDIDTAIIPHKELAELDHPDESVTTRKLRDKSVTLPKLADDVNNLLQRTYVKKSGDTMTGNLEFSPTSSIKLNRKAGGGYHTISDGGVDDNQTNLDLGNRQYTKESNLCCYHRPGWYGKDKGTEFRPFLTIPDISVTYGNVRDGETLPIPEGFNENECTWLLSMDQSNINKIYYDIAEGGARNMLNYECWREGRKAHVGVRLKGLDGISTSYEGNYTRLEGNSREYWVSGSANYICIAVKRA
nr:MAG TPA: tail collar fiber protein [Caudoviricetes sp.]